MGRDRAKEKIQANKKLRLERKEAKLEQKVVVVKVKEQNKNKNVKKSAEVNDQGSGRKDEPAACRRDDGDHFDAAALGSSRGRRSTMMMNNDGSEIRGAAGLPVVAVVGGGVSKKVATSIIFQGDSGDFRGEEGLSSKNAEYRPPSPPPVKVPHVGPLKKFGKGSSSSYNKKDPNKSFTTGPNPNRGKIRPTWRLAMEDEAISKNNKVKESKSSKDKEERLDYTVQDLLKPEDCRILKETLELDCVVWNFVICSCTS
jgi:hypothetical protein